jgi:tetratricopeptide (TPR) repeat protein
MVRLASYWASAFNDTQKANALITKALGPSPAAEDLYGTGRELFSAGAYPMAVEYFKKALAMNPSDGQAVGGLLQSYENMGNRPAAREVLQTWVNSHPTDKGAKQRLDQMDGKLSTDTVIPRSAQ